MGIHNLNQFYTKHLYKIKDYGLELADILGRKPVIGIDAMVLLHKYLLIEAENLCKIEGYIPNIAISCIVKHIKNFYMYGFEVYVVFDGKLPNIKIGERERREDRRRIALENQKWESAFKITPDIINAFIQKLVDEGIQYVVAPYEADPQLYYMEKSHVIDLVYTVDTDLIAYGCKRIIYGIEEDSIYIYENSSDNHIIDIEIEKVKDNHGTYYRCIRMREFPEFNQYDTAHYRILSVLLGNDYVKKIPGLGPVKIKKIMENLKLCFYDKTLKSVDYRRTIEGILEDESVQKCLESYSKKCKRSVKELKEEFKANFVECCNLFDNYPIFDVRDRQIKNTSGSTIDIENVMYSRLFSTPTTYTTQMITE